MKLTKQKVPSMVFVKKFGVRLFEKCEILFSHAFIGFNPQPSRKRPDLRENVDEFYNNNSNLDENLKASINIAPLYCMNPLLKKFNLN